MRVGQLVPLGVSQVQPLQDTNQLGDLSESHLWGLAGQSLALADQAGRVGKEREVAVPAQKLHCLFVPVAGGVLHRMGENWVS